MKMQGLGNWIRRYGSTVFVMVGLAVIGLTVMQVQEQQLTFTRAEGEEEAKALGVWFEPSPALVDANGIANVRLKLSSYQQAMTKARLVFNYDPQLLVIESVEPGTVFGEIDDQSSPGPPSSEITDGQGKLAVISEGEFLGSGTWVKLRARLLTPDAAKLVSDELLSSLQYEDGGSVKVGKFDLQIKY